MALTTPFAQNGDKKAIPQSTSDGSVSFDRGFGSFYALPPEEGGLFIDRAQFNQLMFDTTSQVLENKTAIATKANANATVNLTGNQTIAGVKTFSSPPVSATNPTANNQVANKAYVDTVANTKANANATVNLTGNQSIAGAKTFTSNITAPNITTLQGKVNTLESDVSSIESTINQVISSNVTPIGVYKSVQNKTIGANGDFKTIQEAFTYVQTHQKQTLNQNLTLTLLEDLNNQVLYFRGAWYPYLTIACNGFVLANKLTIDLSCFTINNLKLNDRLAVGDSILWLDGDNIDINFQGNDYPSGCITALAGAIIQVNVKNLNFSATSNKSAFHSRGNSMIYLSANSIITQSAGANCFSVSNGGIIQLNGGLNLTGVTVPKANQAANTITNNGLIIGNYYRI